jgi:hypothetical protein
MRLNRQQASLRTVQGRGFGALVLRLPRGAGRNSPTITCAGPAGLQRGDFFLGNDGFGARHCRRCGLIAALIRKFRVASTRWIASGSARCVRVQQIRRIIFRRSGAVFIRPAGCDSVHIPVLRIERAPTHTTNCCEPHSASLRAFWLTVVGVAIRRSKFAA